MTLAGTFHSNTISKTMNSLIGYITSASLGTCSGGRATILRETLPWHIVYSGFTGTLPNIRSVNMDIIGLSMAVETEGVACLLRTTTTNRWRLRRDYEFFVNQWYWILLLWVYVPVPLTGGFLCTLAGDAEMEGIERPIRDNGGALIAVRLI